MRRLYAKNLSIYITKVILCLGMFINNADIAGNVSDIIRKKINQLD